jgi:hypothetical protein
MLSRYFIPAPVILCERLQAVYDFFKDLNDPIHNRPFFIAEHARRFKVQMAYVAKGYLSDPPDVPMYVRSKTLRTGLVIYRCLRTSSPLEGYHLHLRQVRTTISKMI